MRARRPALPALAAVLAGAFVAGAGTLTSGTPRESAADQGRLALDADGSHLSNGDLDHRRGTKTTTTAPTTTTTQPTTTTEAPPPVTTTAVDTSVTDQVVTLTNAERKQEGCGP